MLNGVEAKINGSDWTDVRVFTTNGRGWTPEELADRALEKILSVSETADPAIKAQAYAYRDRIKYVLIFYMQEAIRSDRTTICAELAKQGHADLAQIISKV
jgi:hypothetical protein